MKKHDTNSTAIDLPYSKSLRARCLVISAIAGKIVRFDNDCDDINALAAAFPAIKQPLADLTAGTGIMDINASNSGTALRFLTAYAAAMPGTAIKLTGTSQLCSRPIRHLADALISLGAEIRYLNEDGYAPLLIHGRKLPGGSVTINAGISSQYISALMLAAPLMESPLHITLDGQPVSESYTRMTAEVMRHYGVFVGFAGRNITVANTKYNFDPRDKSLYNERDWSAATFWFAAAAIHPGHRILLSGLSLASVQPDAVIAEIFRLFGVTCKQKEMGVEISGTGIADNDLTIECRQNPDAIPAIIVTACLMNVRASITGAETLRHKESDRTKALVEELAKCGYTVTFDEKTSTLCNLPTQRHTVIQPVTSAPLPLDTHNDHRIAMALALVGMKRNIRLNDPSVVRKSYPMFWEQYSRLVS